MHWLFTAIKKSGLAAFFVLCGFAPAWAQPGDVARIEQRVDALQLYRHRVWQSLLHLEAGRPQILDPDFLLTGARFDARSEMLASIVGLYAQPESVCRFPARYLWLQRQLDLPPLPLDACPQWQELRTRAPMDALSLVFVTESVVLPASMMGHAFLELSGQTADGHTVAHALSFYTPAETYNLPKLYWQAMVTGKQGVFALAPFNEVRAKYQREEKRNLWLYRLRTSEEDRRLILAHMLELKQTRLLYWFHSYNCATLLRNLLALTGRLPMSREPWETPKDLVKAVHQAGLVSSTDVSLTLEWIVDELHERSSALDQAQRDLLERSRLDVLLADKRITPQQWQQSMQSLTQDTPISLAPALDPVNAPPDAQWGLSLLRQPSGGRMQLTFIPLSHQFLDRQPHSQAETGLEFMSAAISVGEASRLRLERLNIYAMRSLNPWNRTTRRLSSEFKVGYDQLAMHSGMARGALLHFGLGASFRPHPMGDIYGLASLSLGKGSERQQSWQGAEWGSLIRLGADTKAAWSLKTLRAMDGGPGSLLQTRWSLSHALVSQAQFFVHLTDSRYQGRAEKGLELGFKHLF